MSAEAPQLPRILQVIDHLGPGGAQRQFVELAIGLHNKGYPLLVCALDDAQLQFVTPLTTAGVDVQLIPQSGKLDSTAARRLYGVIATFQPDVVQTWLFTADMYARPLARIAAFRCRKKIAVISSVRSAETDKRSHYVWVDRALRPCTDAFLVNANILADTLVEREWVLRGRIHTIYNGIDYNYFSRASAAVKNDSEFLIGYIGRLSAEKRPDLFINAAAEIKTKYPQATFLMLGSGEQSDYRAMADSLSLADCLEIRGFSDDVAPLLKSMDLLISCSDYEGCSNTILEAMAAGVAVLATDVGGNRELIRDDAGWLVPANDASAIAGTAVQICADPSAREAMVAVAQARVVEEFSQGAMVQKHEALYQSLLA